MNASGLPPVIRVFVLDDHDVIHSGFRGLLGSSPDLALAGGAATAAEALDQVPVLKPDVVLIDVNLPDGNGVQVCRELCSAMPGLKCLMMTAGSADDARFAAQLAGAAGFVTKHAPAEEILEAVRRVAGDDGGMDRSGSAALLAAPAAADAEGPDTPRHLITPAELARLTPRQREILELVLAGGTNEAIAEQLGLTEPAVASQISVLFTTLGLRRRLRDAFDEASRIPRQA